MQTSVAIDASTRAGMTTDILDESRLLAEIGVSEQEERAYRLLLARGALAVDDLCQALLLDRAQSAQLLAALEAKGLAVYEPGALPRFLPGTPEVAVEALILRKQATLERTRSAIARLKHEGSSRTAAAPPSPVGSVVTVITGRDLQLQTYRQVQNTAQHELRCLMPAPFVMAGNHAQPEQPRYGSARYLSVLDAAARTDGATMEHIRARSAPNDEWRFARSIPIRVMIADRRLALLALDNDGLDGTLLLVRPSPLLDGLNAMFDMIWARAAHAGPPAAARIAVGDSTSAFCGELEALIPLLAAGLNDKTIAHRLRISVRTLLRRVAKLLNVLDAHSRFQAGWSLALRLHGITAPGNVSDEQPKPESRPDGENQDSPQRRKAPLSEWPGPQPR